MANLSGMSPCCSHLREHSAVEGLKTIRPSPAIRHPTECALRSHDLQCSRIERASRTTVAVNQERSEIGCGFIVQAMELHADRGV